MTTEHGNGKLIGAPVRRVEDAALITGAGCFVEDIRRAGMLHMALLRSPHAHARIVSIDARAAGAMPGVVAVVTGEDVAELRIPVAAVVQGQKIPPHPVLARGAVHAAGVPVAAVVAETRAQAEDAAAAIEVEYDEMPAVVDAEKALEPGAPLAREELSDNVCYVATKKGGDVDKAFAEADHVVRMRIASPRQVALAIEPRGIVADPEPAGRGLTVWASTQAPHRLRADLATALGFPEHKIHLIAPDVGGGFGSKGPLYREYVLACHMALKLGRPVKWIATRSEDFVTMIQGRDQIMRSELALKRDGTMLGLKVRVVANVGAYLYSNTAGPPQRMMAMAPGCYRIQNCHVEVVAVFTNTVPTGPYRGAGRPESVLNIERLVDKAARDLGIDRLELRRKNFIRPEQFPYRTGVGVEYDSGDYDKALAEALRLSRYDDLVRRRDEARRRGELVGVGVSTFVEPSGGAGFESGTVRVERTGEITVLTGSSSHGQGHETSFAQVIADLLRVSMDHVAIRHGDTVAVQQGVGTFGSRSMVMGGGSMAIAAQRVIEKGRRIAAHLAEASPDDIVQADGGFAVAGVPDRRITWRQIAAAAYGGKLPPGMEPGLQETAFFNPRREAWGFGTHVAMVRIDRETGTPSIEKLVLVDDCGVVVNPMIVEGQIHGGVAQGLGEAFREQMLYGENGEILTGTLMHYAVMRAPDMPVLVLGETVTPNPFNPLGVKGVGEAGTNGAPPAVANAVMDALAPLGIDHIDMPYTPPKLWAAIRDAERRAH
ncbi:MAG TPA: xanthine dehydrogenase family protein molybdopterin-binding subunit [candidate division Zixibacteria bacterium]|nr:xanthine dehydrogenase family protein molybdopterin-binding subunit [candidate division Zixibacteria bacterium]